MVKVQVVFLSYILSALGIISQQHSVTSQKVLILNNTTVRNPNFAMVLFSSVLALNFSAFCILLILFISMAV